jgi:hypothetical protein
MPKAKASSSKNKRKKATTIKDLAPKPASTRMVAAGARRRVYITST